MPQISLSKLVMLLAALIALTGCAGQMEAERQKAFGEAVQVCKLRFPAGAHANTTDRVACMSASQTKIMGHFVAYPDLLSLKQQYDLSLARSVDAGSITIQDAALKQAEYQSKLQTVFEQRRNARAIADAQTDQALYSGMALMQANRPVTTNCYHIGPTTNCSTH